MSYQFRVHMLSWHFDPKGGALCQKSPAWPRTTDWRKVTCEECLGRRI